MDNEKELNPTEADEIITEKVAEIAERSAEYKKTELDEELERLTEAFREELKKQRGNEDFDAGYELIQQLQEEDDKENPVNEDELCTCCGQERRSLDRGEDYPYCENCREAMRHYPLSVHHYFILVTVIVVAVFSALLFKSEISGFKNIYKAKQFEKEGKFTSAINSYNDAVKCFRESDTGKVYDCDKIYRRMARDIYYTMPNGANSMNEVVDCIEKGIASLEAKLPVYSEYVDMYNDCKIMISTYEKISELAQGEKYAAFDPEDDKLYDSLMKDMDGLLSEKVTIPSVNNSVELKEYPCSEVMVRYFQYMFSYSCKKEKEAYDYLSLVEKKNPLALWLYGYDLGTMEIQNGNTERALEISELMKKADSENSYAYILEASLHRMNGDLKKSISACEKGFDIGASSPDLYRQKAMTLILQKKFKEAEKECEKGLETEQYGAMYFVYLIAATEAKDKDAVAEINSALNDIGVGYTEKMRDYADGKITYADVLTKGTGDIE